MVILAVGVLGGLAVLLLYLHCPAVDGLELSLLFGAEGKGSLIDLLDWTTQAIGQQHTSPLLISKPLVEPKSQYHPDVTNLRHGNQWLNLQRCH